MTTYCAPCLADLALVREAVTSVSGTASCMAHAVLLTHPTDNPQRRLTRLGELRAMAEGKLETASPEDAATIELLVQEYALAGAMDMTVPLKDLAGDRSPREPRPSKNRRGRGERGEREGQPGRGERTERGERGQRPGRRPQGDEGTAPAEGQDGPTAEPTGSAAEPSSATEAPSPVTESALAVASEPAAPAPTTERPVESASDSAPSDSTPQVADGHGQDTAATPEG